MHAIEITLSNQYETLQGRRSRDDGTQLRNLTSCIRRYCKISWCTNRDLNMKHQSWSTSCLWSNERLHQVTVPQFERKALNHVVTVWLKFRVSLYDNYLVNFLASCKSTARSDKNLQRITVWLRNIWFWTSASCMLLKLLLKCVVPIYRDTTWLDANWNQTLGFVIPWALRNLLQWIHHRAASASPEVKFCGKIRFLETFMNRLKLSIWYIARGPGGAYLELGPGKSLAAILCAGRVLTACCGPRHDARSNTRLHDHQTFLFVLCGLLIFL